VWLYPDRRDRYARRPSRPSGWRRVARRDTIARKPTTTQGASVIDPTITDPDKYSVVFENDRVRVLEYRDAPGQRTGEHDHPDSVMVTLSGFERRLTVGDVSRDVALEPGEVRWLDAQSHIGENIGSTPTHVVFVELKETRGQSPTS
jgi:quercetin dioxygenase-like cupin family protein